MMGKRVIEKPGEKLLDATETPKAEQTEEGETESLLVFPSEKVSKRFEWDC